MFNSSSETMNNNCLRDCVTDILLNYSTFFSKLRPHSKIGTLRKQHVITVLKSALLLKVQ